MTAPLPQPDLDRLADAFTEARIASGLSYSDLVNMTGLARQTLFNIASGRVQGNLATWLLLARAFDVSLDELLGPVWDTVPEQTND